MSTEAAAPAAVAPPVGPPSLPPRRTLDLAHLDDDARAAVDAAVERLRGCVDAWGEQFLAVVREHVRGYDVLDDEEIRAGARALLQDEVDELGVLRVPDAALMARLEVMARRRVAAGVAPEALTLAYQLGSRGLLALMDSIAAEVGLPADLLLAVHDSTWELANEAAAVFARVHREVSVRAAQVEAERRSAFARGLLSGALDAARLRTGAAALGLDAGAGHLALAVAAGSPDAVQDAVEAVRAAVRAVDRAAGGQVVFAEMGDVVGLVVPLVPRRVVGHLVGAGAAVGLEEVSSSFEDAVTALRTAQRFGLDGVVHLTDLGPGPLVLAAPRLAAALEARHLGALSGVFGAEVEETVRALLDADRQVDRAARALTVHPNTVRYRVRRFQEESGLDVHRTRDLVTAWWLLNRRRAPSPQSFGPPAT